jgi:chorismate-pyruvate lyase
MTERAVVTDVVDDSFDPLADLLVGGSERPDDLEPVNLRAIGPLLRSLLVIDGTVTKFLEAVAMEPILVEILDQEELQLESDHAELAAEAGTSIIGRTVVLIGARSGRRYARAASLLVVSRLPQSVRDRLEDHPQGLGRIVLDSGLETRREVLWYGRDRGPDDTLMGTASRICRTYRIISGGAPLMLITECFPANLELDD